MKTRVTGPDHLRHTAKFRDFMRSTLHMPARTRDNFLFRGEDVIEHVQVILSL